MFYKQSWQDQKVLIGLTAALAYIFIASGPAFASDSASACAGNFVGVKAFGQIYSRTIGPRFNFKASIILCKI